jgi:hypothetical protein
VREKKGEKVKMKREKAEEQVRGQAEKRKKVKVKREKMGSRWRRG